MRNELRRQFVHYFFGCVMILALGFIGAVNFLFLSAGITVFGLSLSLHAKRSKKSFLHKIIKAVGREEEKKLPGRGAIMFFAGTLLASLLFYSNFLVLMGALLVLVFGDSIATIVGKEIGKFKLYNNRTLEGTAAGVVISFFYLQIIFQPWIAISAAIIGMLAEFIPIDDNITIPLAAGFVLSLLI